MPVYALTEELSFPHPALARDDGLLAVGGDLEPQRLILAYQNGIFPWYSEGKPILWWCPSPRLVLEPHALRINRTLRKVMRRGQFQVTADRDFEAVVEHCARAPRPDQDGTWITDDMRAAYLRLHRLGIAHSIEARTDDGELVGGLYGLSLGGAFFGESMFCRVPNASKVAFATLVGRLVDWDFDLVDCQVVTEHMVRFGAESWDLDRFLSALDHTTDRPTRRGSWTSDFGAASC